MNFVLGVAKIAHWIMLSSRGGLGGKNDEVTFRTTNLKNLNNKKDVCVRH